MEWMLQVVDEIDDAIGAARHGWLSINVGIGGLLASLGTAMRLRGSPSRTRP
jgi:hypothetical protein